MIAKNILEHEEISCFQYWNIYVSYDSERQMYKIFIKSNKTIDDVKIEEKENYYEIMGNIYKSAYVYDYQKRK